MTSSSKENYREDRRRANEICRERKREILKRQIESIDVDRERADTRKYYQTVKRFRRGFQSRLNACKENSGKLIEGIIKCYSIGPDISKLNLKKI